MGSCRSRPGRAGFQCLELGAGNAIVCSELTGLRCGGRKTMTEKCCQQKRAHSPVSGAQGVSDTSSRSRHRRAETARSHHPVLPAQRDSHPEEAQRRRQKVPQGLWDGKQGHVVHRLPLEEGLPAVHRLSGGQARPSHSCLSLQRELLKAQGKPS